MSCGSCGENSRVGVRDDDGGDEEYPSNIVQFEEFQEQGGYNKYRAGCTMPMVVGKCLNYVVVSNEQ